MVEKGRWSGGKKTERRLKEIAPWRHLAGIEGD
jgi:hypothetical protein